LVEFNRLMMKCPKTIRFQWQRYIINRNKKPSDFLTEENVIERPFRTNSYKKGLKSFSLSVGILCLFSAVFMIASHLTPDAQVGKMILSLVTPAIALFVGGIYTAFSRVLYNTLMSDLYFSFTNFEKGIDRAVANMHEAIDYDIIFTQKEIQNGIPALQEYLEQRALYEQEQIKRAQESEVRHEIYNFDALGVNGSLVMQRAIKESEIYLGNKKRLENEIEVLNADKNNEQKKFDDENRMRLRNLRDIRETISGLKNKIEMASNEISKTNYRRQQSAEVEKEQNLEKEIKKATDEFNKKVSKLDKEIDGKNQEIQDCKNSTEKALIDEFKHFFEKINKDSEKFAKEKVENEIKSLERERDDLNALLEEKDKLMAEKLSLYEDKVESFDAVTLESQERFNEISDLKAQLNELNQEIDNKNQEIFEVKQELESRKREILKKDETIENYKNKNQVEVYRYFDANGTEFSSYRIYCR